MPRGIYSNLRCNFTAMKNREKMSPTELQKDAVQAYLSSPYKGMLLNWGLGSGKTFGAISIAEKMLETKRVNHIYILSPGSLRSEWLNEYCKVCQNCDNLKYYTFVTYNYTVGKNLPDLSGSLVVIDEVHNLINGAKNFSKNPTEIYNAIEKSDCKVLALSGTPVINYVYEFFILARLLKPEEFDDIRVGSQIDAGKYLSLFVQNVDGTLQPKNPTLVKRKLEGIVSYYPGAGKDFVPEVIEQPPIKIQMTGPQEQNYWVQQIQEESFSRPPNTKLAKTDPKMFELLKRMYIMAKKRIMTRSASNFFYLPLFKKRKDMLGPADLYEQEEEELKQLAEREKRKQEKKGSSAEEILQQELDIIQPHKNQGWINKAYFSQGELATVYSTKIMAFLVNLIAHINQKHVLFTFFKEKAGVYLIKNILRMCGIKASIFSGDLIDSQRRDLLKKFNSTKNRYGEKIKVLLVTEAGAEGISVLEARHMHILDSSPRMSKTIQAIGRVARYKSHINLPEDERNINVWRYWSMASSEPVTITTTIVTPDGIENKTSRMITNKETVDEILYYNGMATVKKINSFLDILKTVSVTPWEIN